MTSDAARTAAGIKAVADVEAARARRDRDANARANARPAPVAITARPGRPERSIAQTLRCPFASCHALPGDPCRTASGRVLAGGPHPSRLAAALAARTGPVTAPRESQ